MAAQTLMATIQTLSPPTLCSSSSSSSPYLRQVFCCYGKYNSLSQRWNVGALSIQGLNLFGFTHLLKSKKRRTFICAVNQDAEEAFKKTVEVDRLIDRLRDTDPKELQKLVVENILAFNKGFWIRLAARTDTCKSEDYKKHYEKLTISVRGILDRLVHKTSENIESSTGIFKEILKPVVLEEEEITWPPRGPVAIIKMENEIAQRQVQVDEVFFSEVNGELRQATQATLATKTLLTSEEATIAAASAEAVTLAKAAVKVAKDAALLFYNDESSAKAERTSKLSSDAYSSHFKWSLHMKTEVTEVGDSEGAIAAVVEDCSVQYILDESDDVEPIHEELERLREQLFNSVAVRSRRQRERKAKRTRAAEKAAANVVSVKSGSISKKKRSSLQEVDHSDPLRYLRATTSTSRLLTATEEIQLSEGIQDLLKLEKLQEELAKRCGSQPTFAQWAAAAGIDQKNLRKRLNYGILCKDKMIKSNIRLVISIAKNYQGAGMNLPDLVQEGCRGLVRGAEKFDASKGFKFSTYAHWWIKQAVHKSLSDQSRIIRLPFHMVEASYKVKEARKQLYSENGRQPDDEEIAEATGLSMKRLAAVLLTPKAPRSLEQKIGINQSLKPSEVIADPDAETSEDVLSRQFMRQDLEKVLDSLNPREKQVIRWRFGMEDGRMKTLQEIGEIMRVSRERIRQIESCAFRKLKNRKRIKNLQQYLVS